jgi:hypothetical protein
MSRITRWWRRLFRDPLLDAEYVEALQDRSRRPKKYVPSRHVKIAGSEECISWLPEPGEGITSSAMLGRTGTRFRG